MARFLLIAFIGLGPLQWITLANLGLTIKPVHLPFFIASGLGFVGLIRGQQQAVGGPVVFFAAFYSVYVLAMMASVILGGEAVYTAKVLIHFIAAAGFFFFLMQISRADFLAGLLYGGVVATVGFFAVAWVTLAGRGVNLFETIFTALSTGNHALLQFKIFLNLFNENASDVDRVGASLRQVVMGFIFLSLLSGAYCLLEQRQKLAWITVGLALFILLISLSRSQIIAVFLATFPILLYQARRTGILTLIVCFVALIGGTMFLFSSASDGVTAIIEKRFGGLDEDGRVAMYRATLNLINERPFIGYGAGTKVYYGGRSEVPVHSLMLGAWHQMGAIGLISAFGFTLALVGIYASSVLRSLARPGIVALAGMLVLPIFRSQVSGNGGNYTLPEWGCIVISVALLIRIAEDERHAGTFQRRAASPPFDGGAEPQYAR